MKVQAISILTYSKYMSTGQTSQVYLI